MLRNDRVDLVHDLASGVDTQVEPREAGGGHLDVLREQADGHVGEEPGDSASPLET